MRRVTIRFFPTIRPHWPGEASVDGATVRVLGGPGANNGFCLPATTTAAAMTITAVGHYCRSPRTVRYWFEIRLGGTEFNIFLCVLYHRRPLIAFLVISFVRRQTVKTKWLKTTSGVSMVARCVKMKKTAMVSAGYVRAHRASTPTRTTRFYFTSRMPWYRRCSYRIPSSFIFIITTLMPTFIFGHWRNAASFIA